MQLLFFFLLFFLFIGFWFWRRPDLFGAFSREFLKVLMGHDPTNLQLLEERRANRDGATPLICAVKRNDLDAALQLLSFGASPHTADANGDTPLHHAVMAGSARITKLLLCFDADPNRQNRAGNPVYGMKMSLEVAAILQFLRDWDHYGVNCPTTHVDARQEHSVEYQKAKSPAQKAQSLRLLSLDGGGIRGLVLIQMLMELEKLVDGQQQKKKTGQTNFIERHFDWIAGTSTGAILALALADGTSLIDCLRLYLRLKDDIFGPEAKLFRGYKPECFEHCLVQQFGQRKLSELKFGEKMKVFVTATKADQFPLELLLFRNYPSPFANSQNRPDKVPIWYAARCSSAAPTYFPSLDGLMDGGLIANNPTLALLDEIDQSDQIAFVLSLGTGRPPVRRVGSIDFWLQTVMSALTRFWSYLRTFSHLVKMFTEQVTCSDGVVVKIARKMCHNQQVPYFRLTPQLRMDIPFDVIDNGIIVDLMWEAKVHIREHSAQDVQDLISMLRVFDKGI